MKSSGAASGGRRMPDMVGIALTTVRVWLAGGAGLTIVTLEPPTKGAPR